MTGLAARSRIGVTTIRWLALAIGLGLFIGLAPGMVGGGVLALVGFGLIVLVEPSLGLIVMLCIAPLKTLIATESPLPLPFDVGQIGLGCVIFAWMIWRTTQQRYGDLPLSRLYLPLLGIMLGFSPSLFNAVSPGAWLSEMLKWAEILLLVVIVLDLRRRWSWIVFGVILAAALQAVIGLYEYFGGSGAPHLWISNYQNFRAFGTFGQPNPFSAFMGLSLPLSLGMAWGYATKGYAGWCTDRQNWVGPGLLALAYAGFSVLLFGGLIVSWGRGAWLGFGAAAAVMVFFAPRRRWLAVLMLAAGGLLVGLLWVTGLVPATIQQRIDNTLTEFVGFGDMRGVPINNDNFAIVERLAHWQAAYYMANAHPFIGVGLGNYEAVYPDYALPSWPRALGHAHNDYLNLLAETGIVGLAVYLVGWGFIAYWTIRALRLSDPVQRGLALGLLGTWTHLAVHSFVDKLYVNNIFLHVGVMVGLLAVIYCRLLEENDGII
jgi:O-antigen ligase